MFSNGLYFGENDRKHCPQGVHKRERERRFILTYKITDSAHLLISILFLFLKLNRKEGSSGMMVLSTMVRLLFS